MSKLQIEYIDIDTINPYGNNAKQHPEEQVQQIINSITEFGFNDPIAIDENNTIIEGHGRWMALNRMIMAGTYSDHMIPVIRLTGLSDEQKRAYILAHNKLTMNTGFDPDLLASELESIFTINMADFGFLDDVTDVDLPEDDYEVPDADERVVRAQYGDVYRLGNHRLMCGNSADPDDVRKLMNGTLADLFLTDPPYNVAIGSKNQMLSKIRPRSEDNTIKQDIHGDDKAKTDDEMARDLWRPAFLNAIANAWDHCACYVFAPPGDTEYVMAKALMSAGWNAKHRLVWVKNEATFSMGRLDYDYQHEPIMYGWKRTHHFYNSEYMKSLINQLPANIDEIDGDAAKVLLKQLLSEERSTSIIRVDRPQHASLHPTMKPVSLFGKLINNSTKPGDVVLDLFGGSGTTIIAAEELNRKAYVMELDPHYVDVIIDRWEAYTCQKAEQIV